MDFEMYGLKNPEEEKKDDAVTETLEDKAPEAAEETEAAEEAEATEEVTEEAEEVAEEAEATDEVALTEETEATEDIERMAAIVPSEKPYLKTSVFEIFKNRIPWLLLLMISATVTSAIISHYEAALANMVILTSFIPMLMGTGGNAGSQASVTVIRGISLDEIRMGNIFNVLFKELRVSLLCGIVLAIATFIKVLLIDRASVTISFVVALTLLAAIVVAKLVGGSLPILAKRLGFDPAVMASPFITTIIDAVTLILYFAIASALLLS